MDSALKHHDSKTTKTRPPSSKQQNPKEAAERILRENHPQRVIPQDSKSSGRGNSFLSPERLNLKASNQNSNRKLD